MSAVFVATLDSKAVFVLCKFEISDNKLLILEHLKHHEKGYMKDLLEALKNDIPRITINKYLEELRNEGKIKFVGNPKISRGKNKGYWHIM
jgi:predicted transcriptional regulator